MKAFAANDTAVTVVVAEPILSAAAFTLSASCVRAIYTANRAEKTGVLASQPGSKSPKSV